MRPVLSIQLFGGFHLVAGDTPVAGLSAPRQQSLLTYLLLHRQSPQPRRLIATRLWPESSERQALTNLRRELHHLKKNLPDSPRYLQIEHRRLAWRGDSSVELDIADFEGEISRAKQARQGGPYIQARQAWRNALAIYQGPLTPTIQEEWLLPHREKFQLQYVLVLEQLFEIASAEDDYSRAVHYAERLIRQDPLQESWYRRLIQLHLSRANRAEALRIYNLCVETLRHELDVKPSPKTRRLFQRLVAQKRTKVRSQNFPGDTTPFIGRRGELVELARFLLDEDCRCLTLVGPGGIGKTRLAVQAALSAETEFSGEFEHGIYFVPLVSVETAGELVAAISDSLGLPFQPGEDPRQQLIYYLSEKSLLLLLDNFEQLYEARDLIVQLGRNAPGVKLLITSRVRLNLKNEWVFEVKGLGFGSSLAKETPDDQSAARLFYTSASRIHVELDQNEASFPAVQRICHLLEGNPLAIELAATWAGTLPPEEIAAEIEGKLDFLTSGQIDVPKRHRSMRAVLDRSWSMLTKEERSLLRKLSVFPAPFDRRAAGEIADGRLRVLSSLVDKSMLRRHPDGLYDMHRLLRQFAEEKLEDHPSERDEVIERFSRFYLNYMYAMEPDLRGREAPKALRTIAADLGHIRLAWNLAIQSVELETLGAAAASLYLFFDLRGRFQEGLNHFAAAAEVLGGHNEKNETALDKLRLLHSRLRIFEAGMNYRLGRYEQAEEILKTCRRRLEELNREREEAQALLLLGQIAFRRGEYESARSNLEQSLKAFQVMPDRWERATALSYLGDVLRSLGEYSQAKAHLLEALAIRRELGNPGRVADSLNTLAILICDTGDYQQGLAMFQESLAIRRTLKDPWGVAKVLNNLGILRTRMGDYDLAREHHEESLTLRQKISNPFGVAIALHNLGVLAEKSGNLFEAEARFREALLIRRRIDSKDGIASTLNKLGNLALRAGDEAGARTYFKEALQIAVDIQAVPMALSITDEIAALLIRKGQKEFAAEVLTFIHDHPATDTNTLNEVEGRLDRLRAEQRSRAGSRSTPEETIRDLNDLIVRLLAIL